MTLHRVDKLSDERLTEYVRLTDHQLRDLVDPAHSRMICESALVIKTALDMNLVPSSLFIEERRMESIKDILDRIPSEVPIYVATGDLMSAVCGYHVTRGVLGCFPRPKQMTVEEALKGATRIAVLEDIVDVTNVGAIFRSAAALGIDALLLAPRCADPLNRRAIRVSMGTVLQVPWARMADPWPKATFELLHAQGFTCAAMALDESAVALDDPVLSSLGRVALFFGTEGDGLTHESLEGCDMKITIPMCHGVDSLNVAAASAVAFWQLCHHRHAQGISDAFPPQAHRCCAS